MRTLELFYEAAGKAFKEARIESDLQGITVGDGIVFLLWLDPTGKLQKTIWPDAVNKWENVYRELRTLNRDSIPPPPILPVDLSGNFSR
jgi:hypothetical protein